MTSTITFHVGDVRDVLAAMPDSSVDLLVTSPPFLALRSYLPEGHPDKHREIGAETTPAAFLDTMLGLTADWRRVVADWGSIAVEIGDTYSGSGGAGGDYGPDGMRAGQPKWRGYSGNARRDVERTKEHNVGRLPVAAGPGWPLAKSLCGIPTLYTWSLAYGRNLLTGTPSPAGQWRVRNLLTWTRPNPPVGALGDKFRPATSFVTVACVSDKRWFDLDAVRTEHKTADAITRPRAVGAKDREIGKDGPNTGGNPAGAPPLDWWDANDWQPLHRLPTQPYKGSHYAAFPVALPARLIEAMCPREVCTACGEPRRRMTVDTPELAEAKRRFKWESGGLERGLKKDATTRVDVSGARLTIGWTDCGHDTYRPGIVLDPFGGSGTTALAAAQAGRDAVLIDIDRRNVDLARHRIADAMRVVSEKWTRRDGPRTDETGRCGRTPKTNTPWVRPQPIPIVDTVTWTVDPGLPGLKGQHPDQLSLLGDIA